MLINIQFVIIRIFQNYLDNREIEIRLKIGYKIDTVSVLSCVNMKKCRELRQLLREIVSD